MFYDTRPIQSHNAILNFTDTVRNVGKTTAHKISAVVRFIKHHFKTEWLRYFKNDVKHMMKKDFITKKHIQLINDELNRNLKTPRYNITKDNFKQDGGFVYFRKDDKCKWEWFISICSLSDEQAVKSADDPDTRRLIFDEYRIKPERLVRYQGDPVTDFLSIWVTIKRNNHVKAFLLGNKEAITDPFKSFFGIQSIDAKFEGIMTFKNGTIAVEQINTEPCEIADDFDAKFKELVKNTSYGNYLYDGEIRNVDKSRIKSKPKNCVLYCCFDVGRPVSAYLDKFNNIYFQLGIDKTRTVAVDRMTDKYKRAYVITGIDKNTRFQTLNWSFKMNRIYYANAESYEQAFKVLKILTITKGV